MSRTPYRVLVALLAIAIPAAPARAQAGPQFLGQIGFSSARIGGSPEANDFKSRNGFFGGIGVGITRENGLGGRIEVNYEQKGVELPKEAEVRNGVQLGYIEIPVLLRYSLGTSDMTARPSVFLGPAIGFQVDCKQQALDTGTGFYEEVGCPPDILRGTTFDGVVGAELEVVGLVVGARYSYGFTKLLKEDGAPSLKNRMWALSVGYMF